MVSEMMATGYDQLNGENEAEEVPVEEDGALTPHRIRLIQASWEKVRGLGSETVGVLIFKNVFTSCWKAGPQPGLLLHETSLYHHQGRGERSCGPDLWVLDHRALAHAHRGI